MSEETHLKPCPFCGGEARRLDLDEGEGLTVADDNYGGSIIECSACHASSPVQFGFKENLVDSWNRRANSPTISTPREEPGEAA